MTDRIRAPGPQPLPAARRRALALLGAVVLVAHALLLGGRAVPRTAADEARRNGSAAGAAPSLRVRQIIVSPPATPVERRPQAARVSVVASAVARPDTPAAPAAVPMQAVGAGEPPPVYSTRLPPPVTLNYAWQRGAAQGQATLAWQPDAAGYRLAMQMQPAAGTPAHGSVSQGVLDAAGIAPERYAELRRGRERRAANFQRAAGRITFSASALDHPLHAGAQDRLSWMIQLAGVLTADPARATPGAQVTLFVAGTRGDADAWVFTVRGRETLDLPSGVVRDAVHLQREPQRPYDTRVDVWLDPARHHLPVRTTLMLHPTGDNLTLQLERLDAP